MEEILLLTVTHTAQAGEDLFVSPPLPADQYDFDHDGLQRVKIVTPHGRLIEKDAEFSIPLGTRSRFFILILPDTQAAEIPAGSQVWIRKSLA